MCVSSQGLELVPICASAFPRASLFLVVLLWACLVGTLCFLGLHLG